MTPEEHFRDNEQKSRLDRQRKKAGPSLGQLINGHLEDKLSPRKIKPDYSHVIGIGLCMAVIVAGTGVAIWVTHHQEERESILTTQCKELPGCLEWVNECAKHSDMLSCVERGTKLKGKP